MGDSYSYMIIVISSSFPRSRSNFPIKNENKNTARAGVSFYLSPTPLPALSNPRASYSPPPPGGGRSGRRSICGDRAAGWLVRLILCSVPLSHYRSFAIAIRSAGGRGIAICAVFVSSFSRHPIENEDDAAASARSDGLAAWLVCYLPKAVAATVVVMMVCGGGRSERDAMGGGLRVSMVSIGERHGGSGAGRGTGRKAGR